jgi:hypothetical protein
MSDGAKGSGNPLGTHGIYRVVADALQKRRNKLSSNDIWAVSNALDDALRATPPAAPAGGESKEARSARRRGHTCSSQYVMRELPDPDCAACNAAPAQSIGDEGEREAAIERIISIRNGMTPDPEARAIVRRELAALGAAPSNGDEGQSQWEPVKKLMAANEQLQERLAKARAALEEARQSLALADKMISEHIEEYHDFDYEPHQVPPELASLRAIEHHLMGSLILDEDIAALKDASL